MTTSKALGRVLVIDDNADFRELIGSALVRAGYEVTLAGDGTRGVEAQRSRASDLAITDIFMPETDGIETIGLFKREFPGTPVIAMSGGSKYSRRGGVDYLSTVRRFGAVRVLQKPFDIDDLLEAVRDVMKPSGVT